MKKVKISLFILLTAVSLFIIPSLWANTTYVSGHITADTTWTQAGSPYIVTGDVTVDSSITLTINSGVKVKFEPNQDDQSSGEDASRCELIVEGTLITQGTQTDSIRFTSNSDSVAPGDWYGIRFEAPSDDCIIDYCIIEYGICGISCLYASPSISHSLIQKNYVLIEAGEYMGCGILCGHSQAIIRANTIRENGKLDESKAQAKFLKEDTLHTGIICYDSELDIVNNIITENGDRGIHCWGNITGVCSSNVIQNHPCGIYCGGVVCSLKIANNAVGNPGIDTSVGICLCVYEDNSIEIFNNQIHNSFIGIEVNLVGRQNVLSDVKIDGNEISGNKQGILIDGPGFWSGYHFTEIVFTNNIIVDNDSIGIKIEPHIISPDSVIRIINFGNLVNTDTTDDGRNKIYNNGEWDVYNATSDTILAQGNYWGGIWDPDSIDPHIYDDNENPAIGPVLFGVSGALPQDVTWRSLDVIITGDVTVDSSVNLRLEPKITLYFGLWDDEESGIHSDKIEFIVKGQLISVGTEANPICFTSASVSPTLRDWYGIRFVEYEGVKQSKNGEEKFIRILNILNTISPNNLIEKLVEIKQIYRQNKFIKYNSTKSHGWQIKHLLIEFASTGIGMWRVPGIIIDSSEIRNSGTGVYLYQSGYLNLQNSKIKDVNLGIWCDELDSVKINENRFENVGCGICTNHLLKSEIKNNSFNQISDVGIWNGSSESDIIKDNILSAKNVGILITGTSDYPVSQDSMRLSIYGNTISDAQYGIHIRNTYQPTPYPTTIILDSNLIARNDIGIHLIGMEDTLFSLVSTHNAIIYNDSIGVYLEEGTFGSINFGDLTNADTTDDGNNIIYQNGTWNIYNGISDTIMAQNCLWGMLDPDSIDVTIYDNGEDSLSGPVIFTNLSSGPLRIQLKAITDFSGDTTNYVGMAVDATDSFDVAYDSLEPSTPPSPYVQLYLPHSEWEHPQGDNFRTDIRKFIDLSDSTIIWDFEVKTDQCDTLISIIVTPILSKKNEFEYGILLIDLDKHILQDMIDDSEYIYNSCGGGIHRFQLIVGLGGNNHGGNDWIWTVDSTRDVSGRHYNIRTFTINSDAIMNIKTYDEIDTTGMILIEAQEINILGELLADETGYAGGEGSGAGTEGSKNYGAGGAGYGGRGGDGKGGKAGGFAYADSVFGNENTYDWEMGSGGGNSGISAYKGGVGGGKLKLVCSNTITIDGNISVNGGNGNGWGAGAYTSGGGSGGSVWLTADSLAGGGTISANGGNGYDAGWSDAGGGAGGRVHIKYGGSSFNGGVSVNGGDGPDKALSGQLGSIWIEQEDGLVNIGISSVDTSGTRSSPEGSISGVEFKREDVTLSSNGIILGNTYIKTQNDIIIPTGASITANSKGYHPGEGPGEGTDGSKNYGAGGAGYGGNGGDGKGGKAGGIAYGDSLEPIELGSGGGNAGPYEGGTGGGKIKLECATGSIIIDGTMSANGGSGNGWGNYASGGGSGGSIWLIADSLAGTGYIYANGGNGADEGWADAGGGAGGRICLARNKDNFTGTVEVNGGVGPGNAQDGEVGTIYLTSGGTQLCGGMLKPMIFEFSQNYPNPFVKFTTIKYQIPIKSKVSLKIYDVTGRCVKTLINEEKSIGYYKVKWDGEGLSTGIYFAKFTAGDYKSTKKLILMR